ncbi:MAG TPA: protein kinase [Polyangiaceae bacterium]|nr:protein kinase [Polyangiaceae bacterium]
MANGAPIATADFRAGEVLAGKYRIERVLGAGGMGVVVAAYHLQLDTKVAIKVLRSSMLEDPEATARFAREARAAAKITNEHVARVLDVGSLESGAPYIVMEFLEGEDLACLLQRHGPLPIDRAVDFVLQACVAVADAHKVGIIHRDLKPSNLFCTRRTDGQFVVKVLDFGISKRVDAEAGASVTRTNTVMGSPLYMSPEQLRSTRDVDHRTDIWAFGIILFELLAGRVPFDGETFTEVAVKASTEPPVSLRRLRADTPPGLEAIIERCLAKAPSGRYADVAAFAMALAEFGSRQARSLAERVAAIVGSDPEFVGPSRFAVTSGSLPSALTSSALRVSSRRGPVIALAVAGVAGIAIAWGAYVWAGAHGPAASRASETAAAGSSSGGASAPPVANAPPAANGPPVANAPSQAASAPAPRAEPHAELPAVAPVEPTPQAASLHAPHSKAAGPHGPKLPPATTPPPVESQSVPAPPVQRPAPTDPPAPVDPLSRLKVK